MSAMYRIARHIPVRDRRAMAAVVYSRRASAGEGSGPPAPRCADNRCPMGWLPGMIGNAPGARKIANWLKKHGIAGATTLPRRELISMADEFIAAWDSGEIKNLKRALGLAS